MDDFRARHAQFFDVEALKAKGAKPHWFGIGFIQLKLDFHTRLHFWHPDLTADTSEEELHDHRYPFHSTVLAGSLTHEEWVYELDADGDHEMVLVGCEPGKEAPAVPVSRGRIRQGGSYTMVAGSEYFFPETGFHRIKTKRAVTLLRRDAPVKDFARVIRPLEAQSVCPFSRSIPENELWEYISDLLGSQEEKPGYHLSEIPRGTLGEASKILEETLEFMDAVSQGADIMALVELSDLTGAIEAWLLKHHPTMKPSDLDKMAEITARAFRNGRR